MNSTHPFLFYNSFLGCGGLGGRDVDLGDIEAEGTDILEFSGLELSEPLPLETNFSLFKHNHLFFKDVSSES